MTIYLIRHASAGSRGIFDGSDAERPLDDVGRRQADAIAELLGSVGVDHLATSAALRCQQTIGPLAHVLGFEVVVDDCLFEGQSAVRAVDEIRRLARAGHTAALCSHGDIIPDSIQMLAREGMTISGPRGWAKGSTWRLDVRGPDVVQAKFLGPF